MAKKFEEQDVQLQADRNAGFNYALLQIEVWRGSYDGRFARLLALLTCPCLPYLAVQLIIWLSLLGPRFPEIFS
jgi:hypothetical protein